MELSNRSILEQRARVLISNLSINEFEAIKMAEKQLEEELNIEGSIINDYRFNRSTS